MLWRPKICIETQKPCEHLNGWKAFDFKIKVESRSYDIFQSEVEAVCFLLSSSYFRLQIFRDQYEVVFLSALRVFFHSKRFDDYLFSFAVLFGRELLSADHME